MPSAQPLALTPCKALTACQCMAPPRAELCACADGTPENPVKARLQSDDGAVIVSVVVRQASNIKPTFTQAGGAGVGRAKTGLFYAFLP